VRVHEGGFGNVTLPVLPDLREKATAVPVTVPVVPVTLTVHVEVPVAEIVIGAQVTLVIVEVRIVRVPVPELAALPESPGYEAFRVTEPAVMPVTVVEHMPPATSAQVAGDGSVTPPVPPDWRAKVIVSPVTVPAKTATVAVQEEVAEIAIGDVHVTVVVVVLGAAGAYMKYVDLVAVLLYPPQVALTL
jgi:hypothetical protein